MAHPARHPQATTFMALYTLHQDAEYLQAGMEVLEEQYRAPLCLSATMCSLLAAWQGKLSMAPCVGFLFDAEP